MDAPKRVQEYICSSGFHKETYSIAVHRITRIWICVISGRISRIQNSIKTEILAQSEMDKIQRFLVRLG